MRFGKTALRQKTMAAQWLMHRVCRLTISPKVTAITEIFTI
jgi:hypothetical protein